MEQVFLFRATEGLGGGFGIQVEEELERHDRR
jgi:hypothetical protein